MSDTPRTDAEAQRGNVTDQGHGYLVSADFARQLERELATLRIAAQAHLDRYVALANSGDAGNWNPEEEEHVIKLRRALKAAQQRDPTASP